MQTKRCSTCKETKPASEFYKNRSTKDGLAYECKMCVYDYSRRYCEANKEKVAEYKRRYRKANKEKVAESSRKWREANKKKIAEKNRRYRENNKERIAEWGRRYREANRNQVSRVSTRCDKEANDRSLELAHRQGLPWEDWEDKFVMVDNGLTEYQKAVKLGRSYQSVRGRKRNLRNKSKNELTTDTVRV